MQLILKAAIIMSRYRYQGKVATEVRRRGYGCSQSYLGKICNGKRVAPKRLKMMLSEILDVPVDKLFTREDPRI